MSTTPHADFTPTRGHYNELSPFRFWCQKVLPITYDDSLSYYELLSKVVDWLNKAMEDIDTLNGDIDSMYETYKELENFVNTYFDSLDAQTLINNKLDAMASDGSLSTLLDPLVTEKFNSLSTRIDNVNNDINTTNRQISVLESRMDAFNTLPPGSTTGNAELVDIRVGADGNTYSTAGTAVREQVDSLMEDIKGYGFGEEMRKVYAETTTSYGITFTVDGDTIVANGTATGVAYIDVVKFTPLKTGKYLLKGCPTGGSGSASNPTFIMYVQGTDKYDTGEGAVYTLTEGVTYTVRIIVYTNYTATNLQFTPTFTYLDSIKEYTKRVNGVEQQTEITDFGFLHAAYQASGIEVSGSRIRACTRLFRASGTFTISLADYTNNRFSVVQYPTNESAEHIDSGWRYDDYTITVDSNHIFGINLSKRDNSAFSDFDAFGLRIVSDEFYWHLATTDDVEKATKVDKWIKPEQYYYDHIFITNINSDTSNIIIPSESLANINSSYRLGFKMIEANVRALNDGNYIVCHGGGSGSLYFGTQFVHADGVTDISTVKISDVSLDWVRDNVRYRTSYAKYATYPATLQEFLLECRAYGMTAVVYCLDQNVVDIANSILGHNWVAYNATRSMTDGLIMQVMNYRTVEEIITRCRMFGNPFMYCMGNTLDFTLDELRAIVQRVHSEGYKIGYVQYFINERFNQEYKNMGFDFCASSWSVNRIDNGNICNLCGDLTYTDFTTTGEVSNGVLTLEYGETVVPAEALSNVFLGKGELNVEFEGHIVIAMGRHINMTFKSETSPVVCVSTYFLNESPTFTITGDSESVKINSIVYKASRC